MIPVLNLLLKLIDLNYEDHEEERSVEANVTQTLLKEAFSVFTLGT